MPEAARVLDGTLLGFDFGHRRIGVAVGQTLTGTANALVVLTSSDTPDWPALTRLVNEWKPVAMVVGLPLAADGGETDMSKDARRFGDELHKRFGCPVSFQDERLTSLAADERFASARNRGGMRRKDVAMKDAMAAQVILENWLQENGA
jgi:putative Holliday junction resolvase